MRHLTRIFLVLAVLTVVVSCSSPPAEDDPAASPGTTIEIPTIGSSAALPQLLATPSGDLLLVWTARGPDGVDIFAARGEAETYAAPVRINSVPGSVNVITIDEMRPALATGPSDLLAVAWTDTEYDIQVAISHDSGVSFDTPIRLNQDAGDALQEFPSIAFDENGVLHAV